jgi:hypothetical protein
VKNLHTHKLQNWYLHYICIKMVTLGDEMGGGFSTQGGKEMQQHFNWNREFGRCVYRQTDNIETFC